MQKHFLRKHCKNKTQALYTRNWPWDVFFDSMVLINLNALPLWIGVLKLRYTYSFGLSLKTDSRLFLLLLSALPWVSEIHWDPVPSNTQAYSHRDNIILSSQLLFFYSSYLKIFWVNLRILWLKTLLLSIFKNWQFNNSETGGVGLAVLNARSYWYSNYKEVLLKMQENTIFDIA